MRRSALSCVFLLFPLLPAGCSSTGPDGPPPPTTSPVSGVILIDGEPLSKMAAIELKLYPKGRVPKPEERIPKCVVGRDGKFAFSAYRDGDGAEPGEYVISAEMLRISISGMMGPDGLGNNFNSPFNEDPRFQVKVVEGEPTELPTIDINTNELEPQPMHPLASRPGKT